MKQLFAAATAFALVGCGGEQAASPSPEAPEAASEALLANGLTAKATIEARQANYKKFGKSFKTISDALKAGATSTPEVAEAGATLADLAPQIGDWFPEGSGAASGVETDALDAIWERPDDFAAAIAKLEAAAPALATATASGEAAAIDAAFREAGAACKNCHDSFRAEQN